MYKLIDIFNEVIQVRYINEFLMTTEMKTVFSLFVHNLLGVKYYMILITNILGIR